MQTILRTKSKKYLELYSFVTFLSFFILFGPGLSACSKPEKSKLSRSESPKLLMQGQERVKSEFIHVSGSITREKR